MFDLMGKTALVTGAGQRIGRALALDLAEHGMDVVVHYRRSGTAAEDLVRQITAHGRRRAWAVGSDLSDPAAAAVLMEGAVDRAGRVDVLVNSASIFGKSALGDCSWDHLEANMRVNAFAPLVLCRSFARQTDQGVVINLLDTRVTGPDPAHAVYHLSKRTLFALTRMLAWELAPGIRVNGVAPGLILPPPGEDNSYLEAQKHQVPLVRVGTPKEVCEAARFLIRSEFVTGQVIFVDGGRHMTGSFY